MYHCATMSMSGHIAAGPQGAVIIEPADLPPVDARGGFVELTPPQAGTYLFVTRGMRWQQAAHTDRSRR